MKLQAGILAVKERGSLLPPTEDRVIVQLTEMLAQIGADVAVAESVPAEREKIEAKLIDYADRLGLDLVLTAGGTGLGPDDVTPDATTAVLDREVPAIAQAMIMSVFLNRTKKAIISRAVSGIRKKTVILNLPGSPRPARENLETILDTLAHVVAMVRPDREG